MHYSQFYYDETRAASNYASPRIKLQTEETSENKSEVFETVKISKVLITVLSLGLSAVFFSNDIETKTPTDIQTNLEK